MMANMPRPRPPHLQKEGPRWYVRKGKGPRIRINAEFGTDEFAALYKAAIEETPIRVKGAPSIDSLAWLIARYRETTVWTQGLSAATRRQRENIFMHVLETAGDDKYIHITQKVIEKGKERRATTPAQARNFLDAMRGLFRWAKKAGHVKTDPTAGVENPPRPKGDGFIPWTEEHVEKYRKRWQPGTKERVWLELLLATGLRRGDAVRFGKQHIREVEADGRKIKIGCIPTEKSQDEIAAVFPIWPEFEEAMKAGPCGDLAFIVGTAGEPLIKESFGNFFREACSEAKVPGSAHGLRKLAAIRAAHKGATTAQLRALFGWTNDAMPSLYTKSADRQRMAIEVAVNETRKSIPSSAMAVRAAGRKRK